MVPHFSEYQQFGGLILNSTIHSYQAVANTLTNLNIVFLLICIFPSTLYLLFITNTDFII